MNVHFGALADSLREQADSQGFIIEGVEIFEKNIDAWNRLRMSGYLSSSQANIVARRMIKEIGLKAKQK